MPQPSPYCEEVRRFYTRLGDKTLPLGLGCAYLGQAGDADTQRRYQETLEQAYASGMRYYDTAEMYGGSEFRVGRFLRTIDRDTVFVATKSTIPEELTPDEAALHVRQSLHNSLERLGVETIDLFQVHAVDSLNQVLPAGGVLETLREAKAKGLIRYIGMATRWHDVSAESARHPEFDTILTFLDYTLIDQTAAPLIRFAQEQGRGVINATPLANGLLIGKDPRTDTEKHPEVRRHRYRATQIYDFSVREGIPLLALALQYPMQHPGIHITLTGPANPEQLQANLAACRVEIPADVWNRLHTELGVHQP
ncbi:MAG TPA: aldo/keto reductase [Chthonomonadaceae bacterium]|nr:aldo/keto reductase [Chthonomonadaceae bacterium]